MITINVPVDQLANGDAFLDCCIILAIGVFIIGLIRGTVTDNPRFVGICGIAAVIIVTIGALYNTLKLYEKKANKQTGERLTIVTPQKI